MGAVWHHWGVVYGTGIWHHIWCHLAPFIVTRYACRNSWHLALLADDAV